MTAIQEIVGYAFIAVGIFFMLMGSIGLITLPDFYCRSHASSKVDTTGVVSLLFGMAILQGVSFNAGKLIVAILFLALSNPVAIHALARAARRDGLAPWTLQQKAESRREK